MIFTCLSMYFVSILVIFKMPALLNVYQCTLGTRYIYSRIPCDFIIPTIVLVDTSYTYSVVKCYELLCMYGCSASYILGVQS